MSTGCPLKICIGTLKGILSSQKSVSGIVPNNPMLLPLFSLFFLFSSHTERQLLSIIICRAHIMTCKLLLTNVILECYNVDIFGNTDKFLTD